MAEERLIDADKDKKYRIRINENGEEELEVYEGEEQEEDVFFTGLEVPESQTDDESLADLSPEKAYMLRKAREKEREEAEQKALSLYEKALSAAEVGNNQTALIALDEAQKVCDGVYQVLRLKLKLLTNNFTSFGAVDECAELAEEFKDCAPQAERESLSADCKDALLKELEKQKSKTEQLRLQNQQKKDERAARFQTDFKRCLRNFLIAVAPFVALLIAGIAFSTVMFSDRGGSMLITTIVLFALAFVALIVCVILARPLARAARRIKLNQKDSSTALGREYMQNCKTLENFERLYAALSL